MREPSGDGRRQIGKLGVTKFVKKQKAPDGSEAFEGRKLLANARMATEPFPRRKSIQL